MIKIITEFFFGRRTETKYDFKPGYTTTYHGGVTNFADWCKEFRVSMLADRKKVHF